jgi:hypothetical protein
MLAVQLYGAGTFPFLCLPVCLPALHRKLHYRPPLRSPVLLQGASLTLNYFRLPGPSSRCFADAYFLTDSPFLIQGVPLTLKVFNYLIPQLKTLKAPFRKIINQLDRIFLSIGSKNNPYDQKNYLPHITIQGFIALSTFL